MDLLENLNGSKYLALFYSNEKYGRMFDRIRYLTILKSNILDDYSYSPKDTKNKINSDYDLILEKAIDIDSVVMLIIINCFFMKIKITTIIMCF